MTTSEVASPPAMQLAIEDAALGRPVEILSADHQTKPDVGAQIARRWFDTENVKMITGLGDGLYAVSNTGCDRGQLELRIMEAIGDGPAVVFVDMVGGSCMIATLRQLQDRDDVKLVTGVNLAMLLDFVFHREQTAADAAERAVQTGGEAIRAR